MSTVTGMGVLPAGCTLEGVAPEKVRPRSFRAADLAVLVASAVSSGALTWLVFFRMAMLTGGFGFLVVWYAAFVVVHWTVVREMEGAVAARDRIAGVAIASAALALFLPLASIVLFVVKRGVEGLSADFFKDTLEFTGSADAGGGVFHAIVGTAEQIGIAIVLTAPLGLMTAVYLSEIRGRFRRPLRALVDAMSGVPSIVAGLFVYSVWRLQLGHKASGFAGALALSVLMLPTVTRTSEEMLRLVPGGLREASLALGASEWRTVWRVVVPTARAGLVTSVLLGVARAIGETAPLILTVDGRPSTNWNPMSGSQASLPLFVFQQYKLQTGPALERAWAGALVLLTMVLVLFSLARAASARRKHRR